MTCYCKQENVRGCPVWSDKSFFSTNKKEGPINGMSDYFIYICLDRCWPTGFLLCSYTKGFAPATILRSLTPPHMVRFTHCFCLLADVK